MSSVTRAEKIYALQMARELLKRKARSHFKPFVRYTKEDYEMKWFHALICEKLDLFQKGKIKKLAIFVPPQSGKSELTTRRFPAYLVGKNPNLKIGVISYNSTVAANFNRSLQRVIDTPEYLALFPDTKLNESEYHNVRQKDKQRTTEQLDILGTDGFIKTIGWGGSLTSIPLDIGIIDDPIKDREEAQSEDMRAKLYDWYTDVFKTRLHNDSQQLIIQTRWHEHDLAGRILLDEKDWEVIKLPAIRTKDVVDYDPREPGEALWPEKHSLARLREVEATNPVTFNSLYQQNPQPNKDVLIYNDWIKIPEFPAHIKEVSWGLDFGKTTGINALVKGAVTSDTTKSWVKRAGIMVELERHNAYLKEYIYAAGIPPSEIAKVLFANGYTEGEIVWCDHMPTKIRELQLLGVTALPAVKGPGSISSGIEKMHEYQVYYVGENMKMEVDKYQYVTYDIIVTNVPVPNQADHCFTGETTIITDRGLKEINKISVGDNVLTSKGFRPVLIKWNNGVQPIKKYLIEFDTFCLTLRCTENHLIKTLHSWQKISSLQSGETVYLSSILMGTGIAYIQESDISAEVPKGCTMQYGATLTGLFRQDIISTTKITILGIISLITWKLKNALSTKANMVKSALEKTLNCIYFFKRKGRIQQRNGMLVPRALNGINSMHKIWDSANSSMAQENAPFVPKSSLLRLQNNSFVQMPVNQSSGVIQELIISNNYASVAELPLAQISTKRIDFAEKHVVLKVTVLQEENQEVYDLTIADAHEYFANGLLVHNCLDAAKYCLISRFFREG